MNLSRFNTKETTALLYSLPQGITPLSAKGVFIFYTAYPVGWIFSGRPEMFRTPFQEMLTCFVPLKMTRQNVSYPLFCPKPNMFRTPQFCNNTDICFVPPSPNSVTTLICFVPLPIICWNNQICLVPPPPPHRHRMPQCLVAACVCLFDCWCNAKRFQDIEYHQLQ